MKNFYKNLAIGLTIFFGGILYVYAAPSYTLHRSLLPETTNTYYLGSTSPNLQWKGIYTQDLTITGTCTGCGGSGNSKFATSTTDINAIYAALANKLGIGTTSPYSALGVAGQIVADTIFATSTTATSTFANGLIIGPTGNRITTPSTELILEQTGDSGGSGATRLRLQNRAGSSGAIFQNTALDLVDFGFLPSSGYQGNLRYEQRDGSVMFPSNAVGGEVQFLENTLGSFSYVFALGTSSGYINAETLQVGDASAGGAVPTAGISVIGADTAVRPTIAMRQLNHAQYGFDFDLETASVGRFDFNRVSNGSRSTVWSVLRDANRMGIGTNNPQSLLDIAGGTAIGSYAGVNAAPSNGLIVSGNVGIGSTTPFSKLDIDGHSVLTGSVTTNSGNRKARLGGLPADLTYSGLWFTSSAPDATNYTFLSDGSNSFINSVSGSKTYFRINNGDVMTISGSSVGIGYTSPNERLSISGDFALANGGFMGFTSNTAVDTTNYAMYGDSGSTVINAPTGSGYIDFRTNNSNRLSLDSSRAYFTGNIGAGSSTPTERLGVAGNAAVANGVIATAYTATSSAATSTFIGGFTAGTSGDHKFTVTAGEAYVGIGNIGVPGKPSAYLEIGGNNGIDIIKARRTGGTAAFFVSGGGNVGIGTEVPGYTTEVNGSLNATTLYQNGVQVTNVSPGGSSGDAQINNGSGGFSGVAGTSNSGSNVVVGLGTTNGIATTFGFASAGASCSDNSVTTDTYGVVTSCGTYSDSTLKTSINDMPSVLNYFDQIRPVTFKWKQSVLNDNKGLGTTTQYGLIAQELIDMGAPFSGFVSTSTIKVGTTTQSVFSINYGRFISITLQAIKELKQKWDSVFTTIAGKTTATVNCVALKDTDGVGVTYLTGNNGQLTSTTTKPSNCN